MSKFFLLIFLFSLTLFAQEPDLFLLNIYQKDMNITGYLMSEKLDGVRAYWDGKKLISRAGNVFDAPEFFTKNLPKFELDGELWSKRGNFENISSIVRTKGNSARWHELSYNIFEVPHASGNLLARLNKVKPYRNKYLKVIPQTLCLNKTMLLEYQEQIKHLGGEGIVLRKNIAYHTKRTNNDLKVKPYMDAECTITGYTKGKGKQLNQVGALKCQLKDGKILKIGSGLSDKERKSPPKIGAIITFKYYGFTKNKIPRFPVYLRERSL